MRKKIMPVVFLFILWSGLGGAAGQLVEEIVAIVNDDIITLSQYKQYHDSFYQVLRMQLQGEEFEKQYEKFKSEILNNMITELLLLQKAKEKQFNVNEQVKAYIENIKKDNNIQSDEQLRQELQRQGMDYEQFIKQIEDNVLRQTLILYEVDRSIVVEETEVVNYYRLHPDEFVIPEEYKLRAIYLSSEERSTDDVEAIRKEVEDKVKAGEDFAELAGQYSDGPIKENRGDLGSLKRGELDKDLQQAVEKLKPGEVTPWVQAKAGWYLLKLEEKKESRQSTFEEVKKTIEAKIGEEKRGKKIEEFLKDTREKSYIKILKPNPLNL